VSDRSLAERLVRTGGEIALELQGDGVRNEAELRG